MVGTAIDVGDRVGVTRHSDIVTAPQAADPLVGKMFDGRFLVEERIGSGGCGAIYRARYVDSLHPIALKVLLPHLAHNLGLVARFRREGAALIELRNPHTIAAYEVGETPDHTLFIVMELLRGESLFDRYRATGPLEWRRIVKIACEVCASLDEAHALGIVHRDLKPANIHLERTGKDLEFVKVFDFGIAKTLRGFEITNQGEVFGTPDYMSPEQLSSDAITPQSDIYSLGIIMYEMIAGRLPFPAATSVTPACASKLTMVPEGLARHARVPAELDQIVMRCLERAPGQRYQTVAELRDDLERTMSAHRQPAPKLPADAETLIAPAGIASLGESDAIEDAPTTARPPEVDEMMMSSRPVMTRSQHPEPVHAGPWLARGLLPPPSLYTSLARSSRGLPYGGRHVWMPRLFWIGVLVAMVAASLVVVRCA